MKKISDASHPKKTFAQGELMTTIPMEPVRVPYQTQLNYKWLPQFWAKNNKPSKTVPNQSLSVKEIMERHRMGMPFNGAHIAQYYGEEYVPDFERLDISERHAMIQANKERIQKIRGELQEKAEKEYMQKLIVKYQEETGQKLVPKDQIDVPVDKNKV